MLSEQFVHRALSLADTCVILTRGASRLGRTCVRSGHEVIDRYLGDGTDLRGASRVTKVTATPLGGSGSEVGRIDGVTEIGVDGSLRSADPAMGPV